MNPLRSVDVCFLLFCFCRLPSSQDAVGQQLNQNNHGDGFYPGDTQVPVTGPTGMVHRRLTVP